ncbi:alpha/beta hydrolase [Patescibacteria group bacterium]|nr:alpha/beta hydrolase [Patescibacteria group bacterium]
MNYVKFEEKQILIDGLKINYKQIGDGNIPIILLHGWGVSSDKYTETAKELLRFTIYDLRFTIFIPDLPGFGKSDNPPEAWEVNDYVEFIKEFQVQLGSRASKSNLEAELPSKKIILIGHSFGGRIAIKFAAKYPEKLKALILTGAAGIKHPPTIKQKLFFALAKGGKVIFSLPLINYFKKPAQKLLYKIIREKDYYEAHGVMKETFKKIIAEDLAPFLEKISAFGAAPAGGQGSAAGGKTPTLLVWGGKDKSTPLSDGKFMHFKIQNSKFKIIFNANHSLPYQYPEKFANIVMEFIKKTDNG